MWKLIKALKYLKDSGIIASLLSRRPKSLLGIAGVIVSLYGLGFTDFATCLRNNA